MQHILLRSFHENIMKLYKVYAKETFSFNVLKTYYKMTAL